MSRGQLSLAHCVKVKTDMLEKTTKTAGVSGISLVGGTIKELLRKGFVEKMGFKPGVEERRSDGW